MRWSWKLGTFGGISVYLHGTFLLLLAWMLLANLLAGLETREILGELLFVSLIFGCVVLHELGHAWMARRFGIPTRDITLYPIGGVARMHRIPREPHQELLIALAGPAVNAVIATGLFVALASGSQLQVAEPIRLVGGSIPGKLLWMNVAMAVFNLVPAYPMDGGRILRALLAARMEYTRATIVAAHVGQALAFAFALAGLIFNPFLIFIAFFVFVGAAEEAAHVQAEAAFHGVPVRQAMVTQFSRLSADDLLSEATVRLLAGSQHDFPVLRGDQLVGFLTRDALILGLSEYGSGGTVADVMQPLQPEVKPSDSLEIAFRQLEEGEMRTLPVVEDGRLLGLLTRENVGEFLLVREALRRASTRAHSTPI